MSGQRNDIEARLITSTAIGQATAFVNVGRAQDDPISEAEAVAAKYASRDPRELAMLVGALAVSHELLRERMR